MSLRACCWCWLCCAGSVLTALPTPWGLLVTCPGCHSAVLQCRRQQGISMQGISLNLIYCQLTHSLLITDSCTVGEKEGIYNWTNTEGITFPYLSSGSPSVKHLFFPPFSPQLPLFSLLVPTFPPSQSLQWGDRQLGSRYVGFCPCNSFLVLPCFLLLCPSVAHPRPVKKWCTAGLLPMLVDTSSWHTCQENKMGVFYHTDLCSQWKSGV